MKRGNDNNKSKFVAFCISAIAITLTASVCLVSMIFLTDSIVEVDADMKNDLEAFDRISVSTIITNIDEDEANPQPGGTSNNVAILGDGISTFNGIVPSGYNSHYPSGDVTDVTQTWWDKLITDKGHNLLVNSSMSDSYVSGDSTSSSAKTTTTDARISTLAVNGTNPDTIIIELGSTDFINNVPLGTNDGNTDVSDGTIDNFSDAYTLLLNKIHTAYPTANVMCCGLTTINQRDAGGNLSQLTRSDGLKDTDFSKQIKTIATTNSCTYVEMPKQSDSELYPTADCMQKIRDAFDGKLQASNPTPNPPMPGLPTPGPAPTPTPIPSDDEIDFTGNGYDSYCYTYMAWQFITSKTSAQYKWRQSLFPGWVNDKHGVGDPSAFDAEGFGVVEGRYVVAVSNKADGGIGEIGMKLDVYLDNGITLPCIVGDIKSNKDSDWTIWGHKKGTSMNTIEFIVDYNKWYKPSKTNPGNAGNHPEWRGKIVKIVRSK